MDLQPFPPSYSRGRLARAEMRGLLFLRPSTTVEIRQYFHWLHSTNVYKHIRTLYKAQEIYIAGWEVHSSRPRGLRIPRFALCPSEAPGQDAPYPQLEDRTLRHRKPGVQRLWGPITPRIRC